MSNWTHIAAVIRIDDWRHKVGEHPDFDILIGKECLFHSSNEKWSDAEQNPDKYLPMGSEGTLQKSVWINPKTYDVPRYTVSIFGDLRDHDNPQEIIDWFQKICNKQNLIRNAVITVSNERNGELTWTWSK